MLTQARARFGNQTYRAEGQERTRTNGPVVGQEGRSQNRSYWELGRRQGFTKTQAHSKIPSRKLNQIRTMGLLRPTRFQQILRNKYIGLQAGREKNVFMFLTKQEDQTDLSLKGNKPQNCFRVIISWKSHQSERGESWEQHSSREWKEWAALSSCQPEAESQVSQ